MSTWTDERIEQLEMMEEMMIDLANINNGSGFMQKMERIISTAEDLTKSNIGKGERSFCGFVINLVNNSKL